MKNSYLLNRQHLNYNTYKLWVIFNLFMRNIVLIIIALRDCYQHIISDSMTIDYVQFDIVIWGISGQSTICQYIFLLWTERFWMLICLFIELHILVSLVLNKVISWTFSLSMMPSNLTMIHKIRTFVFIIILPSFRTFIQLHISHIE